MKKFILTAIFLTTFSMTASANDYAYKVAESCANGLTLTFSTSQQIPILQRFEMPMYECTDLEAPTAPEDSGCRASKIVGQNIGFKAQLGTLKYSNNLGNQSAGPMTINVYADLPDNSGLTEDTLSYQLDDQLGSLDTLNSTWGDGLDEYEGTALNPLPSVGGVQKSGNQFPGLAGYADRVFANVSSVIVYSPNCPDRVTALRQ